LSQSVTCLKCGRVADRVDGHLPDGWDWRYNGSYGNRFLPQREWGRYYFCSPACVEPFDEEAAGTGYA
jgi:hypothetical protein